MGSLGKNPPHYVPVRPADNVQATSYSAMVAQISAASVSSRSPDTATFTVFGRSIDEWILWAGFIGFTPGSMPEGYDLLLELECLRRNRPDEWAAFIAAQRIQGRDFQP